MDLTSLRNPSSHMRVAKAMPVVREPVLRKIRKYSRNMSLNLEPRQNREAVMFQCVGPVAEVPCKCCANNRGPFAECVQSDDFWRKECANCHFNSNGFRCEYHVNNREDKAGKREKSVRIAHMRGRRDNEQGASERKGPSGNKSSSKKRNASGQKEQQVVQQSSVDVQQAERIYRLMNTAGASFEAAAVGLSTVGQTLMMVAGLYAEDAGFVGDYGVQEEAKGKKRKKREGDKSGLKEKKKKGKKGKKDHQNKKQRRK
ncbi:hypothetical protein BO94DRAFT_621960 [Aspergillus sclerotioniger CBS 115572]|uniref:Uncharacterized protein n=1 Tax=Aspergillus sclerotioniger CBS 115572 TaxID=1450535 RepID=A0A317X7H0_9EURO|nr:hypothetical protein BO94DRAFT_621960 [Aspergillus sclerotioniger CBS 115572]PWY93582.1 hypothetical protein BO94DRAFT_621960 [Aspergillus sclerotioniger CBS 115572]